MAFQVSLFYRDTNLTVVDDVNAVIMYTHDWSDAEAKQKVEERVRSMGHPIPPGYFNAPINFLGGNLSGPAGWFAPGDCDVLLKRTIELFRFVI